MNTVWSLVTGQWLLVIGHWPLVIGHWRQTGDKGQTRIRAHLCSTVVRVLKGITHVQLHATNDENLGAHASSAPPVEGETRQARCLRSQGFSEESPYACAHHEP
uniref:Uncharacterized protein n=1 Tax=Agrobacterium albertimagni TaxID=147266 RepID=A0A7C1NUS2_9HYPH